MDSLTQIVLGAACGEIVLGKKIGNKALLFGAIGGTIPDLDVFIGGFLYLELRYFIYPKATLEKETTSTLEAATYAATVCFSSLIKF